MKKPSKKTILWSAVALGFVVVLAVRCSSGPRSGADLANNGQAPMSTTSQPADKIEVVHFHATQQCWSCTTVGEFALKTIKERFPEEYQNGTIVFKDINAELPENRTIVTKYQASGSSLFVNAIIGDRDAIKEDTTVWRLVSNEQQFMDYFETKLKTLLGKS